MISIIYKEQILYYTCFLEFIEHEFGTENYIEILCNKNIYQSLYNIL